MRKKYAISLPGYTYFLKFDFDNDQIIDPFKSSKKKKRRGQKKMAGKGLFKPAKHKWLADIVTFETPAKARAAAKKLVNYVRTGRRGNLKIGRQRALTILRALNYAANRAEAAAKKRNLSPKERRELREISRIYRRAYEQASRIYKKRFGGN